MYETLKQWTCKVGRVDKLYAFTYQPHPLERNFNGWEIYDPIKEWARQGIGKDGRNPNWRISTINADYTVRLCSRLPLLFFLALVLIRPVLPDLPGVVCRSIINLRQHPQLCGQVPVAGSDSGPHISSPREQLLDYEKFAATGWGTSE